MWEISELFLEDEIELQVQHSKKMCRDFEEEMQFLEKWMTRYIGNEGCIEFANSTNFKEQCGVHILVPCIKGICISWWVTTTTHFREKTKIFLL